MDWVVDVVRRIGGVVVCIELQEGWGKSCRHELTL